MKRKIFIPGVVAVAGVSVVDGGITLLCSLSPIWTDSTMSHMKKLKYTSPINKPPILSLE